MSDASFPLVVATKVLVPALRPEAIARDRVTRLLAAASERPLTVVCAPAGYGKTTAVVEWLRTVADELAWVSLDAQDHDPRRLCAHLLAALDRVWRRWSPPSGRCWPARISSRRSCRWWSTR